MNDLSQLTKRAILRLIFDKVTLADRKLDTIMSTQHEAAVELNRVNEQVMHIGEETRTLIERINELIAQLGEATPELADAVQAVKDQVQIVDDLVPDVPPQP